MRYLGIDYGAKRTGVAISDEKGEFAFPLSVLETSDNLVGQISKICTENNIGEIVVGKSQNFSFQDNKIMKEIVPFVEKLKSAVSLPVRLYPEFLTSQEAERLQGKNEMHDASAAALILKHFLETKK